MHRRHVHTERRLATKASTASGLAARIAVSLGTEMCEFVSLHIGHIREEATAVIPSTLEGLVSVMRSYVALQSTRLRESLAALVAPEALAVLVTI